MRFAHLLLLAIGCIFLHVTSVYAQNNTGTNTTTTQLDSADGDSAMSDLAVAGIVISAIFFAICCATCVLYHCKRKNNNNTWD